MNILSLEKGAGVLGTLTHPPSSALSHQSPSCDGLHSLSFTASSQAVGGTHHFLPGISVISNSGGIMSLGSGTLNDISKRAGNQLQSPLIAPIGRSPCLATFRAGLVSLPALPLPNFLEEFEK